MEHALVATRTELEEVVSEALQQARIALDLEGDGYFRYRARVCTMQLRVADRLVVVDTLACWEPDLLQRLLGPEGPLKVLHDAAFDARLLWAQGVRLEHVFDTALAARLLGEQATGLSSMLAKRCGVEIEKDQQQADWGRRPLDENALRYLYDDVRYLLALHTSLEADVAAAGIGEELAVECEYMLSQARKPAPPRRPPWLRIKGARKLPPLERAVLREVAELRERTAEAWDVPPFRVLHDRALLELARRRPRDLQALRRLRSVSKGRAREIAEAWLAAVARGVRAGDVPQGELADPGSTPSAEERARRRRLERALSKWRASEAKARGVDIQVVLPGHGLQALVGEMPSDRAALSAISGLGQVRIDRYAERWLSLIAATASGESPAPEGRP